MSEIDAAFASRISLLASGGRCAHIYVVCDESGAMVGEKVMALERAVSEMISYFKSLPLDSRIPLVHLDVVAYSDAARLESSGIVNDEYKPPTFLAGGPSSLGAGLAMIAGLIRGLPPTGWHKPVVVLMAEGYPTDDFPSGLRALNTALRSGEIGRVAIGVGSSAPIEELRAFAGDGGMVRVCDPGDLEKEVQDVLPRILGIWASTS